MARVRDIAAERRWVPPPTHRRAMDLIDEARGTDQDRRDYWWTLPRHWRDRILRNTDLRERAIAAGLIEPGTLPPP